MYKAMNKKNLFKQNLELINKIQKIRSKNNLNWMNLLKLSFKHDPKNAAKIMSNVFNDDKKISSLVSQLTKLNKSK
tara:strand:- start:14131 stop:14358 length:228 start_codon:yes stop_codon:yes gene_type:complete